MPEAMDFVLKKIEGEYATLENLKTGEELFIAMALLPAGADVGSKIHWETFEYSLV